MQHETEDSGAEAPGGCGAGQAGHGAALKRRGECAVSDGYNEVALVMAPVCVLHSD